MYIRKFVFVFVFCAIAQLNVFAEMPVNTTSPEPEETWIGVYSYEAEQNVGSVIYVGANGAEVRLTAVFRSMEEARFHCNWSDMRFVGSVAEFVRREPAIGIALLPAMSARGSNWLSAVFGLLNREARNEEDISLGDGPAALIILQRDEHNSRTCFSSANPITQNLIQDLVASGNYGRVVLRYVDTWEDAEAVLRNFGEPIRTLLLGGHGSSNGGGITFGRGTLRFSTTISENTFQWMSPAGTVYIDSCYGASMIPVIAESTEARVIAPGGSVSNLRVNEVTGKIAFMLFGAAVDCYSSRRKGQTRGKAFLLRNTSRNKGQPYGRFPPLVSGIEKAKDDRGFSLGAGPSALIILQKKHHGSMSCFSSTCPTMRKFIQDLADSGKFARVALRYVNNLEEADSLLANFGEPIEMLVLGGRGYQSGERTLLGINRLGFDTKTSENIFQWMSPSGAVYIDFCFGASMTSVIAESTLAHVVAPNGPATGLQMNKISGKIEFVCTADAVDCSSGQREGQTRYVGSSAR